MGKWFMIQNPDLYQGSKREKNYFEGWYYKFVHQSGDHAFALIPGVSLNSKDDQHAFIQLMDGTGGISHYYKYDIDTFFAHPSKLEVRIGDCFFSMDKVEIDLPNMKGTFEITNTTPLKKSMLNPGIMGWYSFTPFMQCYHGIVSMDHNVSGTIEHDGREWNYSNAKGYIEKDWGTSFPKCWIWNQCNTFASGSKRSVFASVAHIPWMGRHFIGYIAAVQDGDTLYRFATYNNAKHKARIEGDSVIVEFKKGDLTLYVKATKGIGVDLKSPIAGEMTGKVNESLTATVHVKLEKNGEVIFEDHGTNAGLEIAGDYEILLKDRF